MRRDSGPVEGSQIVECGAKPYRLDDGRRPRLETCADHYSDLIFRHGFDHLAALIGRMRFRCSYFPKRKPIPEDIELWPVPT